MIFQRWWQSLALSRWCFCGSADRTTPTKKPRRKMEMLFLEVNVATWHHAAFSLPVRNSNFYFIFQVFEVQVKFFGRVLFPFHATWTWKVGNCKQCPFHVHYVSIFLWSKLCCLVHIFSTFFQPFFKQIWDDDLLTRSFQTPQPSDDGASPKAAPTDHLGTLQPAAPWVSRGWGLYNVAVG